MPSVRSNALASAPAATRAAVSRALARSSTSRASVNPYFCMPARSAWPGRGCVSGAAVAPGADDISSAHFPVAHSLLRMTIAIGEPSVRPCRIPPRSSSSSCSKRMRGPAAVAESPARELGRDVVDEDRKAGGHALDRDHEGRTVGLARRQEAQHGVLRSPEDRLGTANCTAPTAPGRRSRSTGVGAAAAPVRVRPSRGGRRLAGASVRAGARRRAAAAVGGVEHASRDRRRELGRPAERSGRLAASASAAVAPASARRAGGELHAVDDDAAAAATRAGSR